MPQLWTRRAMMLSIVLTCTGCCPGGSGGGATLVTAPMQLPPATAATGLPASWFQTVVPGTFLEDEDIVECLQGDVSDVPLTFAVVVVTPDSIAVAGDPVADLSHGVADDTQTRGFLISPLYDQLLELLEFSRGMADIGCRPWAPAADFLPADIQESQNPPLLLAVDASVPAHTLAQVIYTAGQAGFGRMGLWVDDPAPTARTDVSQATVSEEQLALFLDEDGVRWSAEPLAAGSASYAGLSPVPPGDLAAVLATSVDSATPPTASLALESCPTGVVVDAHDTLAGLGVHCAMYSLLEVETPVTPAEGSGGVSHTLDAQSTVAVLPITLPRMSAPGSTGRGVEILMTGHACPTLVGQARGVTEPDVLEELLGGLELPAGLE